MRRLSVFECRYFRSFGRIWCETFMNYSEVWHNYWDHQIVLHLNWSSFTLTIHFVDIHAGLFSFINILWCPHLILMLIKECLLTFMFAITLHRFEQNDHHSLVGMKRYFTWLELAKSNSHWQEPRFVIANRPGPTQFLNSAVSLSMTDTLSHPFRIVSNPRVTIPFVEYRLSRQFRLLATGHHLI